MGTRGHEERYHFVHLVSFQFEEVQHKHRWKEQGHAHKQNMRSDEDIEDKKQSQIEVHERIIFILLNFLSIWKTNSSDSFVYLHFSLLKFAVVHNNILTVVDMGHTRCPGTRRFASRIRMID